MTLILPIAFFVLAYALGACIAIRTFILVCSKEVAANKPADLYAGIGRSK